MANAELSQKQNKISHKDSVINRRFKTAIGGLKYEIRESNMLILLRQSIILLVFIIYTIRVCYYLISTHGFITFKGLLSILLLSYNSDISKKCSNKVLWTALY